MVVRSFLQIRERIISAETRTRYTCEKCGTTMFGEYRHRHDRKCGKGLLVNVKNHLCDLCGKSFTSKGDLEWHAVVHGETMLKCKICGVAEFLTQESIATMLREVELQ